MVFWWTGRGYLALLSLIGVYGFFGAAITVGFGNQAFEAAPWLWGVGALIAAAVNWIWGSRINRRRWADLPGADWKKRLVYRARNRFMGLPMESWALPTALLGVFLMVRGVVVSVPHT